MTATATGSSAGRTTRSSPRVIAGRFLSTWGPALPLIALILVCLVGPAAILVAQSFAGDQGLTLDLWAKILGQRANQDAIVTSLELGLASATVTLLVGAPVAWIISRMLAGRRAFWLGLLNVAANFGGIGLAFAYLATLGAVGMVTLAIQGLGLDFLPPRSSSFIALLLAYEYTNVPLFVLLTIPAMGILQDDWWEAAQTASATRWQFWRLIGLPVLTPFLAGGWILIFTWSIGIYGIAYGLAGQSGGTAVHLITLQIGTALQSDIITGAGRAGILSVVLMAIATVSLLTYRRLLRRGLRWFQ